MLPGSWGYAHEEGGTDMMPSFNSGFAADIRGMMEWRGDARVYRIMLYAAADGF